MGRHRVGWLRLPHTDPMNTSAGLVPRVVV